MSVSPPPRQKPPEYEKAEQFVGFMGWELLGGVALGGADVVFEMGSPDAAAALLGASVYFIYRGIKRWRQVVA